MTRYLTPSRSTMNRYLRSPLGVRQVRQHGGPGGTCPTLRKYARCDISAELLACVDQATEIWVCDFETTHTDRAIKYLNACYYRTDETIDATALPTGAVFLPFGVYDVLSDAGPSYPGTCEDQRCTECFLYYEAHLCPGSQDPPGYRLFLPVARVPICGAFAYPGTFPAWCWYAMPGGPTWTRDEVDALGGVRCEDCGTAGGLDCCECRWFDGCAATTGGNTVDCGLGEIANTSLRCCCSEDYSFSINFNASYMLSIVNDLLIPPQAVKQYQHQTAQGSFGGTVVGGVVSWSGYPAGTTPQAETIDQNYSDPPSPFDFTLYHHDDVVPPFNCIPGNVSPGAFLPASMTVPITCPLGGPWITDVGTPGINYTEVQSTSTTRDCFNYKFTYTARRWELDLQSVPRWEFTAWVDVRISPMGRCGGGCATGTAGTGSPAVLGSYSRGALLSSIGEMLWRPLVAPIAFIEFES